MLESLWRVMPPLADDCGGDANQMQRDMCADQDFRKADDTLNGTDKQIMARLKQTDPARTSLVSAQRAWLGFRDAECKFRSSDAKQGSLYPVVQAHCLRDLTAERVKMLTRLLHCQEGDLDCPVPGP